MSRALLTLSLVCLLASQTVAQPADVPKTNPQKLYMHYMPWFQSPYSLGDGNWGYHWKMNTQDPNVITYDPAYPNGEKRQIASHYYPQIGPYDSTDPDVIEYHLLMMKMAGVDGVIIDWYGVQGTNGDIGSLINASNALVDKVDDFGMDFAVCLEDRFSANVNQAKANVAYLRDNYFNQPDYIRLDAGQNPLLLNFGPITFQNASDWTQILSQAGEDVDFLPLWYHDDLAGSNADGEYAWVDDAAGIQSFYHNRAPVLDVVGGTALPGFNDFYQEGGAGSGYTDIPHNDGQTLADNLALATTYNDRLDFLQLVTWNDFGEGTMFEPTVETGYDYLLQLQQFSGTPYGLSELEIVHDLYLARKAYPDDPTRQAQLDQVSQFLAQLDFTDAQQLLDLVNGVASPIPGDINGDGYVGLDDLQSILDHWNQSVPTGDASMGDIAGPGGGDPDGYVGLDDLQPVLDHWNEGVLPAPTLPGAGIPEPASFTILALTGLLTRRPRTCRINKSRTHMGEKPLTFNL